MSGRLLPNGLGDLLAPQAAHEAALIEKFMTVFAQFGYERVKPPLVEFEDSLFADGPGQALARHTFRLMDPVSQRMMGVRADTTAQIARIAGSRLSNADRPLRLSYAADVLRVKATQLRPERQFCQVGCEMIGARNARDDVEVMLVALLALAQSGIGNISVDLTVPTLLPHLYEEFRTPPAVRDQIAVHLDKRDHDALKTIQDDAAQTIAVIMEMMGPAVDILPKLVALALPGKAGADVALLGDAAGDLQEALSVYGLGDIALTIDPLETRGFDYQTGVSFTFFAKGARGELGRGGRYETGHESAAGFTFYMDTLLRAAPPLQDQAVKSVPAATGWEEIKKLQGAGHNIQRQS